EHMSSLPWTCDVDRWFRYRRPGSAYSTGGHRLVQQRTVLGQRVLLACLDRDRETVLLRRHRTVECVGEGAGREHRAVEVQRHVTRGIRGDEEESAHRVRRIAARRVGEDHL